MNRYIKSNIIEYIYTKIDLQKYKFRLLEYTDDLKHLEKVNYNISSNYYGLNCLLVFLKIQDKYYSVLLDKKTLTYNKENLKIDDITFTPARISMPESIYKGTILDGIVLSSNKTFIINDMYVFRGDSSIHDKIKYKLINIDKFLTIQKINQNTDNNIELVVNPIYDINNIRGLIYNIIPNAKYTNYIKGVCFNPEISGIKLIYLFSNSAKDIKQETNLEMSNNIPDDIVLNFRFKKTDTVDVYELSLSEIFNKDGKKYVKYKKIDIAHIPSCAISKMCREYTSSNNNIIMECKSLKNKWVPLKLSDKTKPDDYENYNSLIKKCDNN
jgi:hypothetical protein